MQKKKKHMTTDTLPPPGPVPCRQPPPPPVQLHHPATGALPRAPTIRWPVPLIVRLQLKLADGPSSASSTSIRSPYFLTFPVTALARAPTYHRQI